MTNKQSIALIKKEQFIKEAKKIHGETFSYDKVDCINRKEFPNEVMEVERALHQHSTI